MTCPVPAEAEPYYAPQAYHPDRVPMQPDAPQRGLIHKLVGMRLPWGNTQEVLPEHIMRDPTPEKMRFSEQLEREKTEQKAKGTYVPRLFEHLDLHYRHDHEVIRHAQWPFRSQFWIFLKVWGKWTTIVFIPVLMFTHLTMLSALEESAWEGSKRLFLELHSWLLGPPLICAIIGHVVIEYCPRLWIRAPKGPLWEINRRTGIVTVYCYKNFKKSGRIGESKAPFVEFDAYIFTHADRHGAVNCLFLNHRYKNLSINLSDMFVPDDMTVTPCALWDFLQNYMDISRPLPDVPAHEDYRHLDPVTAEYDRCTGRNPRYWIDMDDATFKAALNEMIGRTYGIDTFSRPNLMAMHVNYAD